MNNLKLIAIFKNFIARSNGYLLLATFGLSLYNIVGGILFIPAFILGCISMLSLGYADYKLGLFREESLHMAKQNPILIEILENQKRILDNLEDDKRK